MIKIFLVLLLATFSYAQKIDWAKVHDLTASGISKLYNLNTAGAVKDFDEAIKIAPKDPRGHFFKSMTYYYRYFLLAEDDDYNNFLVSADNVKKICEEYLKYHEDASYLFYLGGIKGYSGIIKSIHSQGSPSLSVLKEGKEAYGHLKKSLEINPNNYDSYMGLGLFTYIVGSLPRTFRWVAGVLGFQGDKELGLKYLRIANEKGLYTKSEALWWLTFIYMGQGDEENAAKVLNDVVAKFPTNNLYSFLLATFNMGLGKVDLALTLFEKSSKVYYEDMAKLSNYSLGGFAVAYYYKNDFTRTIEYAEKFLTKVNEKDDKYRNRDNIFYLAGISSEILGNREKAKEYYSKVKTNDIAKLRLNKPLSKSIIEIIKNYNRAYSGNFTEGEENLKKIIFSDISDEEKAYGYYYLGNLFRIYKDYNTAISYYRKVAQYEIYDENWLKPYAQYYIGICYLKKYDKATAKKELEKAEEYKGYYNYKQLSRFIDRAISDAEE